MNASRKHVVIVGAGFAGIHAASTLARHDVDVTLIDRNNHHTFQPLLYQVATADLSPSDIAWPIRQLFRKRQNVSTHLGSVTRIDTESNRVETDAGTFAYDYLILATGAQNFWFGHDDWPSNAPGLKTLVDATQLRSRILTTFESAENESDPLKRKGLLTFVVVGGGPTGVEMAGAIAELAHHTLAEDFRRIDTRKARIILIEGGDRLLAAFPKKLSRYTEESLKGLGVEVRTGEFVQSISSEGVTTSAGEIASSTVVWSAGVRATPVGEWLGVTVEKDGRVSVNADLTVPDMERVYVVGDAARVAWRDNLSVPGIAPGAKQQGRYAARHILAAISGETIAPFNYRHAGNLATIGRHRAIVDFGKFQLKGWLAWWFWGLIHIYFLIGARSAALVLIQWFWSYLRFSKSSRLITRSKDD